MHPIFRPESHSRLKAHKKATVKNVIGYRRRRHNVILSNKKRKLTQTTLYNVTKRKEERKCFHSFAVERDRYILFWLNRLQVDNGGDAVLLL